MAWALTMYPVHLRPSLETQANYTVEWLEMAAKVGEHVFSEALVSAVRNSEFFPVIAKIRQCAGITDKQQSKAGADAAWLWLQTWLRKWPDRGENVGRERDAPELPARILHSARMVGGLKAIEYMKDEAEPFVRRDFCAAWERYEESSNALGDLLISSPLAPKLLGGITAFLPTETRAASEVLQAAIKPMSNIKQGPLSAAEFEDRKEMLRQQAEKLLGK